MRKLASIQIIKALDPIDGADAIERATVLGWQLVVKKGEFKPGDLAIYVEIDSILPDKPEFEFLRPRKMRIRTVRLKGQISQGICFPLSLLPDDFPIVEDADCTRVLGITKYEPPIPACLSGVAKGRFPSFIPKTDETRVQVLQHLLDAYQGVLCYITEKLDGSSVTYYVNNGEFGVCSRNLELLEDDQNSLWKVARQLDVETKLRSVGRNLAIQGELIGEGIQSNKLKIRGQTAMFFNVFDIDTHEYLNYSSLVKLLESLELPVVPLITDTYNLENEMEAIIKRATVKSLICPEVWAEGIVIRPVHEKIDQEFSKELMNNGRISFKAINPEFLLKFGE
jgi:RNA ligase (TIGR02306 family)